jgi:hypothetical protein
MIGSCVHAKKRGQGGKGLAPHKRSERSVNFSKTPFPDVLLFGMNFMNFMNFRYKSSTYSVNAVKQNMNDMNPL